MQVNSDMHGISQYTNNGIRRVPLGSLNTRLRAVAKQRRMATVDGHLYRFNYSLLAGWPYCSAAAYHRACTINTHSWPCM